MKVISIYHIIKNPLACWVSYITKLQMMTKSVLQPQQNSINLRLLFIMCLLILSHLVERSIRWGLSICENLQFACRNSAAQNRMDMQHGQCSWLWLAKNPNLFAS